MKFNLCSIVGLLLVLPSINVAQESKNPVVSNREINDAVEEQFWRDPVVPVDDIGVNTEAGVVSLTGSVDNILAKIRAAKIAENVKGVVAVVNRIEIIPLARSDEQIKADILQTLKWNPATKNQHVIIAVKRANVTLEGMVDSWQLRSLAERLVESVPGVRSVSDQISIQYKTARSDDEIQKEIQSILDWDTLVNNGLVQVSVKDGNVRLSGQIGSAAEKVRATSDSWVAGVKSVDNSLLKVEPWLQDKRLRKNPNVERSDANIRKAIELAYMYDPRVHLFRIEPQVNHAEVTLRGFADSLEAKRAAEQDAHLTVGVISVKDRIRVKPENPPSDRALANEIRSAIKRNVWLGPSDIIVRVVRGKVYLTGNVASFYQKYLAEDIAAATRGVRAVYNYLEPYNISSPYLFDPYLDEWVPSYYLHHPNISSPRYTKPDLDKLLQSNICYALRWTPFLSPEDIKVKVKDGIVTLSGTVDTERERSEAEKKAFEAGAFAIINNIQIKR